VDDKKDNEEGRAPLEYLPRGPRVSSYATDASQHLTIFWFWYFNFMRLSSAVV